MEHFLVIFFGTCKILSLGTRFFPFILLFPPLFLLLFLVSLNRGSNNWCKAVLEWNIANNPAASIHTPRGCSKVNNLNYTLSLRMLFIKYPLLPLFPISFPQPSF